MNENCDNNEPRNRTKYIYDVLGDVLQVNQKGGSTNSTKWRTRTFAYNSLDQLSFSRLILKSLPHLRLWQLA